MSAERRPSLMLSSLFNLGALALNALVAFLLTPLIISHIGKAGFGILVVGWTLIGYYGLLNLGIRQAVWRYVALYSENKDIAAVNSTLGTALAFFLALGVLVLPAAYLAGGHVGLLLDTTGIAPADLRQVVFIFSLLFAVSLPGSLFHVALISHERYLFTNAAEVLCNCVRALLIYYLLANDGGLIAVAWAQLGTEVLAIILRWAAVRFLVPQLRFSPLLFTRERFRELLAFGISTWIIMAGDLLRYQCDAFVIGNSLGMGAVAVYAIAASRILGYVQKAANAATQVLTPRFSRLCAGRDGAGGALEVLARAEVYACCFGGAVLAGLAVGGEAFILRWVGAEFSGSYVVLLLLCVAQYFEVAFSPALNYARGADRQRPLAKATLWEGLANLGLSLIGVRLWGIYGVALATLLTLGGFKLFYWSGHIAGITGQSGWRVCRDKIYGLLLALPFVGMGVWLQPCPAGAGWGLILAYGFGGAFVYMLIYTALFMPRERMVARMMLTRLLTGRCADIRDIIDVAENHLCCGCGVCAYLAPDSLRMVDDSRQGRRPVVIAGADKGDDSSVAALRACPGIALAAPARLAPEDGLFPQLHSDWGNVLGIWEGYATDAQIRREGSSGGAVSALALYAIEKEGYSGALHSKADSRFPFLNHPVFSRNRAEVLSAAGSRYSPASPCEGLRLLEDAPGRGVFIGKPCDVTAALNAARQREVLHEKAGLFISVFCAGAPALQGSFAVFRHLGCADPRSVREFCYRGPGWPGETVLTYDNQGRTERAVMTYDESWGDILQKYRPWRCRVCPDHTGEFADIAVGDPWYDRPQPGEAGRSLILARTPRGLDFVRKAISSGYLIVCELAPEKLPLAQPWLLENRGRVWGQQLACRLAGGPFPQLRGFALFAGWRKLTLKSKLRSVLGTVRRVVGRGLLRREPVKDSSAEWMPRVEDDSADNAAD